MQKFYIQISYYGLLGVANLANLTKQIRYTNHLNRFMVRILVHSLEIGFRYIYAKFHQLWHTFASWVTATTSGLC